MILHRISKAIRAQNWFAVALEFVIVIAGVVIGFQIAAWNDARQRDAITATYYQRLIDDLRVEQRNMLELTAYYQEVRRIGLATLRALEDPDGQLQEGFLISAYQASQIRYYTPQRATYEELLSTGIATVIPDSNVRTLLANYYLTLENADSAHDETTPYRDRLRTFLPYQMQNLVRSNCGETFEFGPDGSLNVELVTDCELAAPAGLVEQSLAALNSYEEMERDLGRHLSNIDLKLASLSAYLDSTRNTLAAMERVQP